MVGLAVLGQDRVRVGGGPVEPQAGTRPDILARPGPAPWATERAENASIPRAASSPSSRVAAADMYTPCPAPIAACESKIAMPTSGRTAMLRECVTSGEETQKNSVKPMCAK